MKLKLLYVTLGYILIFTSSCKKNENTPDETGNPNNEKNSFFFENKTYETPYGNAEFFNEHKTAWVYFSSKEIKNGFEDGIHSYIVLDLAAENNTISNGTFIYKPESDPTFDRAKNFYSAMLHTDASFKNGGWTGGTTGSGKITSNLKSGTIKLLKQGDTYTCQYDLVFGSNAGDKPVKGSFTGKIEISIGNIDW